MSDDMKIRKQEFLWTLRDNLTIIQHGPTVVDPKTGKTVEVVSIYFEYVWSQGWHLLDVWAAGPALENGEYDSGPDTECHFFDPVHGDEGGGRAPQHIIELAQQRMALLPAPPSLPEMGDE